MPRSQKLPLLLDRATPAQSAPPQPTAGDGENRPLRLSVLDQSPIAQGSTGAAALHNSIDLAQLCDRLGYHRYWVAEHHGTPALACTAPEVLIGPIAAATSRIRVGSGGIMLPHYSPLKVAENFSMLAGLYPNRIDLGIGRAAGTDSTTAFALQRNRRERAPAEDFRDQLDELLAYAHNEVNAAHPFARLAATLPGRPETPDPYLLGSSPQSAIWAAELGLPYVFADFINPHGVDIVAHYRRQFAPSPRLAWPRTLVATWVICADTDVAARRLALSFQMMFALMHRGRLIAVPPIETAEQFFAEEPEATADLAATRRLIVGSPDTVRAGIESVARDYAAEEVLLVNILHDHAARRRSYELVAEVFDLTSAQAAPAGTSVRL